MLKKLIAALKQRFKRKPKKREVKTSPLWESYPERRYKPPKAGHQAIHKDLSRFFKGKSKGHLPHYRRSVKAKVKPDEN